MIKEIKRFFIKIKRIIFGVRLKIYYWKFTETRAFRCIYPKKGGRPLIGSAGCVECPAFDGFRKKGSMIHCNGESYYG